MVVWMPECVCLTVQGREGVPVWCLSIMMI